MHQPTNGKAAHPVFVALYDRYNDPKKYKSDNTLPEKKKHTHTHTERGGSRFCVCWHMRFKYDVTISDRNSIN